MGRNCEVASSTHGDGDKNMKMYNRKRVEPRHGRDVYTPSVPGSSNSNVSRCGQQPPSSSQYDVPDMPK